MGSPDNGAGTKCSFSASTRKINLFNPEGEKLLMQPKKQGRRQVVHNEVIKLFCNSLVKAVKDVFYMWNYFFFFCTGSKEADVGEVTGTWKGTTACSPPSSQCHPLSWPAQLLQQKLSFPPPERHEMKSRVGSEVLCGPIQLLYQGCKWLWKQPGYGPGHSKSLPATPCAWG